MVETRLYIDGSHHQPFLFPITIATTTTITTETITTTTTTTTTTTITTTTTTFTTATIGSTVHYQVLKVEYNYAV